MTDKEFWIVVRRALLMVSAAIAKKFGLPLNDLEQRSEATN
jgi:hypothetical protein